MTRYHSAAYKLTQREIMRAKRGPRLAVPEWARAPTPAEWAAECAAMRAAGWRLNASGLWVAK